MGGFHFMLAFRFHRPRAGAGWAASASCWHSASTAPELALEGGVRFLLVFRVHRPRAGAGWAAPTAPELGGFRFLLA